jgi:glycine cleavage system H lipoate-binding protein
MVALGIVAIILLALTLDFFVEKLTVQLAVRKARAAATASRAPAWLPAAIPVGFLVDAAHVWIHRGKDQLLRVGSDGFATALLGKPEEIRLLARPGAIARGKPLAIFLRAGRSLTLRSPVSGTLLECNDGLSAEIATADPFGRGWFASIRPSQPVQEEGMHKGNRARGFLAAEWERVRNFVMDQMRVNAVAEATMADGGSLRPGFLAGLPVASCLDVEAAFFAVASNHARSSEPAAQEGRR